MKIDINKIVPNRFRDFDIDPIDEHQVERLMASIEDLGFFSGVTARKLDDGTYELAAGHHRLEAAERAGLSHIEAVVDNYTDNEMRRIMAIENLTQRGANAGAQQDAVQAFAFQVAYEWLSDRSERNRPEQGNQELTLDQRLLRDQNRGRILKDGPGYRLIYQAINGYHLDEAADRKAEDDKAEMISSSDVRKAVQALKDSGRMGKIVARAYAVVEEERAEDEAEAMEAQRKAEAKAKAEQEKRDAETKRREEAERAAVKRAEEQRIAAEKARKAAAEAEGRRKELAEQKAKEAKAAMEKAQREREAAAKARREAEEKAAAQRKATAEREAQWKKAFQEKAAKEAEEKRKVDAQKSQEAIYDGEAGRQFQDPVYQEAFRKAITERGVRELISRDEQLKVAKAIVKAMKDSKGISGHQAGSVFIANYISDLVAEADKEMRDEINRRSAADKANLANQNQRTRVDAGWERIFSRVNDVEDTMKMLLKENQTWDKNFGRFPAPVKLASLLGITERLEEMVIRMYPNDPGVRRWLEARGREVPDQTLISAS